MIQLVREILEIARPVGRRKLALACAVLLAQAVAQLVAVLSVLPFLSAASDLAAFRASNSGRLILAMFGDASDRTILVSLGVGSLVLLLLGNAMMLFGTWYAGRYAQQVGHRLRLMLVRMLLARRYEYFTGSRGATIVKALGEDITFICHWVLVPALDIFSRAALVAMLVLLVLLFEPLVSLGAIAAIAIFYAVAVMPLRRKGLQLAEAIKLAMREIHFQLGETMASVKLILVNNAERHFEDRIAGASLRLAQVAPRSLLYSAVPRIGFELLVFGGLILWVLVLLTGGGDLASNMPRIGLIALVAYRLMPSLQLIFSSTVQIASLRQSLDEVLELLRDQQAHAAGSARGPEGDVAAMPLTWQHEIRFENVSFAYRGAGGASLEDVSLTIPRGAKVAVAGPTGSGKSTFVDLLMGLLEPTGGRILVDGAPLTGARLRQWRRTVGYVPQDTVLLHASIAENIAFGRAREELDLDRVRQVAGDAQAMTFIERGGGLWTSVGDRGVRLSGGQRQRLALARALYSSPSLLVLDEATSALDPRTEQAVVETIAAIGDGLTTVTVAHRLTTIERCDTVFFLQDGRLAGSGRFDELEASHEGFRDFARARHSRKEAAR